MVCVGFIVFSEVSGVVVVGVVARTLVCSVVESSIAVSVDRIICDLVNGVVDEISCMMLSVGLEESLTRGPEAADTTRSKTSMKTIGDNIFPL